MASTSSSVQTLETGHEDMVHDAVLDYYGKRLATCSSDKTIKVFAVEGDSQRLMDTLRGHDGPVWQVSWAHPKFGTILASASYDSRVIIWRDSSTSPQQSNWSRLFEHTLHTSSVNSIDWAPQDLGAVLACASGDGSVSILEFKDDGTWDTKVFNAHGMGCNAVSWGSALVPGSLVSTGSHAAPANVRKIATGGCDNLVKIWTFDQERNTWVEEDTLRGHTDWVRDVAYMPSIGMPKTYLASASQDKSVIIWTQNAGQPWKKQLLKPEPFADAVWRVSWSLSGGILAVSSGDNKITLWREGLKGEWENVSQVD